MDDLMSVFYILEMVFGGSLFILVGLVLLIVIPLAILSIYSNYKYLKLIGHPKPLLFLIPFYGMHVLGDTVVANEHSEVQITKNFAIPKIVFAWLPLFSLVLSYIPFLGGIISLVINIPYLYILGLDMLKRLKGTNNNADVQVLAIINIFALGCIPLIMTLFRGKDAPFIQPQYSGMHNGGNVGTFAQFADMFSKKNTSNNQWGQAQDQWGQAQSQQGQWGQSSNQWGQQNQWGQSPNQYGQQTQWGQNPSQYGQQGQWGQTPNQYEQQNQWGQYSQPKNYSQWGNVQQKDYSNQVTPDNAWKMETSSFDYANEFASGDTPDENLW